MASQNKSRPSVQLAVSSAAIFWSVAWGSLVREIIDSATTTLSYTWLQLEKGTVLAILVIVVASFSLVLVRWLGSVQIWTWDVSIKEFIIRSRNLVVCWVVLYAFLVTITTGFAISPMWSLYARWAILIWPLLPLVTAMIPEVER